MNGRHVCKGIAGSVLHAFVPLADIGRGMQTQTRHAGAACVLYALSHLRDTRELRV